MDTTTSSSRPDGRRTGAAWVAATGAFLLLAAASTFVAVRWDQIPEVVKLAVVVTTTGSALLAGRTLRAALPATAGVLFHLGAFLVPIDVAAVAVHLGVDWRGMLLVQGLVCTTAFGGLAVAQRSVVLLWATTAATVVLAAGVAGPFGWPTGVVVAVLALVAHLIAGRVPHGGAPADHLAPSAVALAAVAGTAPLLRLVEDVLVPGRSVLVELGLAGVPAGAAAAVSGCVAAFVLGSRAKEREDLRLAVLALLSAGLGLATTVVELSPGGETTTVGLAAAFLAVQLVAHASAADAFWRRPLAIVAQLCEVLAGAAMVPLTLALAFLPVTDWLGDHSPVVPAVVSGLLAAAWFTADLRRRPPGGGLAPALATGGRWAPATPLVMICAALAAGSATGEPGIAGLVLVGSAAAAVWSGRPLGAVVAVAAAVWAPVSAAGQPALSIALGVGGALVVAEAVVRRVPAPGRGADAVHWLLAATATAVAVLTPLAHADGPSTWVIVGAAVAGWVVAVVLDRATRGLGHVARVGVLAVALLVTELDHTGSALAAGAIALLAIGEAARHREPDYALAAAGLSPVVLGSAAAEAGLAAAEAGLALCVAAAVWLGLAALAETEGSGAERWARPLAGAAGACALAGVVLATDDTARLADSLLLVGALLVATGAARRSAVTAHIGGAVATIGLWAHLGVAEVSASEAYLVPVGLQLLVAGWHSRRTTGTSTWSAYVPAVVILGGTGLVERLAGGGGGHALWAGVVGTAAVVVGGRRRLAGPLLAGTSILVAVAVTESLAWSAGVPTWGWLAAGGTLLLVIGIAMDRLATGPVETGRRMIDVVRDRFD